MSVELSWRKRPGMLPHFALLTKTRRPSPEALCDPAEHCLPLTGMEWVDIEHRTFSGVLTSIFWSVGNMLLALTAYLVREWHWLLVAVTGPCLLSIVCLWWVQQPVACFCWNRSRMSFAFLPCVCGKYCSIHPGIGSGNLENLQKWWPGPPQPQGHCLVHLGHQCGSGPTLQKSPRVMGSYSWKPHKIIWLIHMQTPKLHA